LALWACGWAFFLNKFWYTAPLLLLGTALGIWGIFGWTKDLLLEQMLGKRSGIVERNLLIGFLWFIFAELWFFIPLFWCWISNMICPSIWIGGLWPPVGVKPIHPLGYPLTGLIWLLGSGQFINTTIITRLLRVDQEGFKIWITWLENTMLIGLVFLTWYIREVIKVKFTIFHGVFGTAFHFLVGLHATHVLIGLILFATLRLILYKMPGNDDSHALLWLGGIYWHFVDFLYIAIWYLCYLDPWLGYLSRLKYYNY
jgi:heme/copper-type cytochrome/quinol oxidase subunit 3